jgi:acyl-CoA thioesterase FadM
MGLLENKHKVEQQQLTKPQGHTFPVTRFELDFLKSQTLSSPSAYGFFFKMVIEG